MKISRSLGWLAGVLLIRASAFAQADYSPDVAEFTGGDSYAFPANAAFDLNGGGTLEFWVAADWTVDPGYDPVVLSNTGPQGSSYLVAINGERSGLVVNSADQIEAVPFDFSDGKLHHVAIASSEHSTFVMIDGVVVAELPLVLEAKLSAGLWIGSANGTDAPFLGAVGQLRLWSIPLEPLTIIQYLQSDIHGGRTPHPDIDFLEAESDFTHGELLVDPDLVIEDAGHAGVESASVESAALDEPSFLSQE